MTVSTGRRPAIMSVVVCLCGLRRQSWVPRRGHCRGHRGPASVPQVQEAGSLACLATVSLDRQALAHQDRSVDSCRGLDLVAPRSLPTPEVTSGYPNTLICDPRGWTTCVIPAPFCCQEGGFGTAECAPALVAVSAMGEEPKSRRGSHPAWCRVASGVRVREVADPKCRRAGVGRRRWILESPRSALPGPRKVAVRRRAKRLRAAADRWRQRFFA